VIANNLSSWARRARIIRSILGVGLVAIGFVEIYNWGVSPADRIAWAFLESRILLLFGPLLLTIGAFLIFYRRSFGNQGVTGTQGDAGTQGDTGRKGETGEQRGDTGEKVDTGTGTKGDLGANSAAAGATDAKGDPGAGTIRVRDSKILLWIGGGLISVPVGLLFMANSSSSEILGFFGGVALFLFGLPGLVFIAIGAGRLKCLRLLLTASSAHLRALWRDL
jgi:hypothetical protein